MVCWTSKRNQTTAYADKHQLILPKMNLPERGKKTDNRKKDEKNTTRKKTTPGVIRTLAAGVRRDTAPVTPCRIDGATRLI